MKISHLITLLCCGFAAACSTANHEFPREEVLKSELMPLQGLTYPGRIEIKHPYLILQNWKMRDSIFHVYDLTNYELKHIFGTKGEGPEEFITPWLIQSQTSDFLITDITQNQIHSFGFDEKGQLVAKSIRQPAYDQGLNDAIFINDSLFVADPKYMLIPSLYLVNIQDSLPQKTWTYRNPEILAYTSDPDMGQAYANGNRIIFCYGIKKQIDFMDTEFNLIKRVKFQYNTPTINEADDYGNLRMSYTYAYLGKHYLYAVFFGTSWNEYRTKTDNGITLEVFDLNGNPVIKYKLEGRRPAYFAVDEETFTLYGAGEDEIPEDHLLIYKLKGLS